MSENPDNLMRLVLSVKAVRWRAEDPDSHEKDEGFRKIRPKVLERDKHTCKGCGFKSESWQEVHHLDDDHANNNLLNLVTLCSFCHMTQHIGLAGQKGEASLIWMPELPQYAINHLVRSIMVAETSAKESLNNKEFQDIAQAAAVLRAKLTAREVDAKRLIGTSSAAVLGDVLLRLAAESGDKFYPRREMLLDGIRLLPRGVRKGEDNKDIMAEMLKAWMTAKGGPYAVGRSVKEWRHLLSQIIGGR